MKKCALLLLLAAILGAGCANRYDITLSNGTVITSRGKPQFDKQKNAYVYKDPNGQPAVIPAFRVSQIAPQSMSEDKPSQFIQSKQK